VSKAPGFWAWVMSPVWMRNAGFGSSALIRPMAASKVPSASGFAAPLKPMWVSLICTKLKLSPDCASAGPGPNARERGTPPTTDQMRPVPVHAMHCRKPRRSTSCPSLMLSSSPA
jgi:hypothetical protein